LILSSLEVKLKIMKTILVTGAAGFMGSDLVDKLVEMGHTVHGVDDLSGGFIENVNPKSRFKKLDLRQREETENYIAEIKPEIIFHLAADAALGRSQFTPIRSTERNYNAHLNVLVPAVKNGLKKLVLTSSMDVYGDQKPPFSEDMELKPNDIYGISKMAMEKSTAILSDVFGFEYTIIRPHNVYGPRQNMVDPYRNVIAIFINCLLNDKNFYIYGDGEQKRAFSYIDDFTPYIIKAAFDDKTNGEIFNIGPVQEVSINELAEIVLDKFFEGKPVEDRLKPKHLPPRPREVKEAWCTVGKAEKLLGYKTTVSLEEGIKRMIRWAREKGPQAFKYLDELELSNGDTPPTWVKKLI
jgi:UDP-glucose 4-epimerase